MNVSPVKSDTWSIYGLVKSGGSDIRYVGLTRQTLQERLRQHISLSRVSTKRRPVTDWIRSIDYEVDIQVLESISSIDDQETLLYTREMFWIKSLRESGNDLLNLSLGGESGSFGARWKLEDSKIRRGESHPRTGKPLSKEAKEKLSESMTGRSRSEESRKKQGDSIRGANHWAYGGGKFSDEHRKKLSEANKGKTNSAETRKRISEALKGRPSIHKGRENKGAHMRWHVNRGLVSPKCSFCTGDIPL